MKQFRTKSPETLKEPAAFDNVLAVPAFLLADYEPIYVADDEILFLANTD